MKRVTLTINDQLLSQAKELSQTRGTNLSDLVSDLLTRELISGPALPDQLSLKSPSEPMTSQGSILLGRGAQLVALLRGKGDLDMTTDEIMTLTRGD